MIVFDDMIAKMLSNKNLYPLITELFCRSRKLNISLVFIIKSYFSVRGNIRLNSTHFYTLFYYENPKQKRASRNCI